MELGSRVTRFTAWMEATAPWVERLPASPSNACLNWSLLRRWIRWTTPCVAFRCTRYQSYPCTALIAPMLLQETVEVLSRILVGPENYDYHFYMGELRLSGASPVIYPPDADGCGYTYWRKFRVATKLQSRTPLCGCCVHLI
jgi:hypothetical protein